MEMKKNKLFEFIILVVLFLYLVFSNLSNHNVYGNVAIIMLAFFSVALILYKGKMYFNRYFAFYLLFVFYQLLLIVFGFAFDKESTYGVLSTLVVNFSILLMIYNIVINISDMEKILKIYLWASAVSLAIIMFLLRNSLFSGRLAHAYGEGAVSFYFLGNKIAISSNSIAFYSVVSVLFCLYFLLKTKKIRYLLLIIFLSLGCIMTGSRKGILMLIIYFTFFINFYYKGKYLKKTIILGTIFLIFYIAITKVSALYNIIGIRLGALFDKLIGAGTHEGSITARETYKNYALAIIPNNLIHGYGSGYFSHRFGNITEINYLELLVSGGIIGLVIYYTNYLFIFIDYIKHRKCLSDISKILFMAFFSILIYDIGAVTYTVRSILIVIVLFIGSVKVDLLKESDFNGN